MTERPISPHLSDHDLLIRIDERTMVMQSQLIKMDTTQTTQENRIEALEKWQANITGRLAVIAVVASFVGAAVVRFLFSWLKLP